MSDTKQTRKKRRRYYLKLVEYSFLAMLISYLTIVFAVTILARIGIISFRTSVRIAPWLIILTFVIGALVVGMFTMTILANVFMRPIDAISDGTRKVAKGDFNVQIDEIDDDSQMGELIKNFNLMVKELRSMETLRSDFVSNVSHEFKTPLSTIQGYSTLLQDESLLPEERMAYTKYIIDATQQLSNLTSNILKLSKLESEECSIERKSIAVDEQVRQAILFLENQWSIKNIDLDIELSPFTATASEELMMQVWLNIVGNAIKYSDYAGKIVVKGVVVDGKYEVSVQDYGPGMSEKTKKRIFEKFYQGDGSHSKEGSGVGLALVKKIIDVHGYSISVETKLGYGSCFTVTMDKEVA